MLSDPPHRLVAPPSQHRDWGAVSVPPVGRKICMVLLYDRTPGPLQFHLGSLQPDQVLENFSVPDKKMWLSICVQAQFTSKRYSLFLLIRVYF